MRRHRALKRIRWLTAMVIGAGCLGACAYVIRSRILEHAAQRSYAQGKLDLARGEYFSALNEIGKFVQRHPRNGDALFDYARAREQVPEPNNQNIVEAISLFRRAMAINQDDLLAAHELFSLYGAVGFNTEIIDLADRILKEHPDEPLALKSKALALYRLRRLDANDAPAVAMRYSLLNPNDLQGQVLVLQVFSQLDGPESRLKDRAETIRRQFHDDPRSEILSCAACDMAGDKDAAAKWAEKAAEEPLESDELVRLLVEECDRLGLYPQTLAVLQRNARQRATPESISMLAGRLWQLERYAELVNSTSRPRDTLDVQTRAIRCLSLSQIGQSDAARSECAALKQAAGNDPEWGDVVSALITENGPNDIEVINAATSLLKRQPYNPYAHFFLGEAYARVSETDAAVQEYKSVIADAPAWSTPYLRLASASMNMGDRAEGLELARQAVNRSPDNPDALIMLASIEASGLVPGQKENLNSVLQLIDHIDAIGNSPLRALPIRIQILAAAGRSEEAKQILMNLLSAKVSSPGDVLLQLSALSDAYSLGLGDACLDRCEQVYGVSPDLAYARAKKTIISGKSQKAIARFNAEMAKAPKESLEWDLAHAKLLDLGGDAGARAAWIALADEYPKDIKLQWMALSAQAVQGDRDFTGRVLDRLRDELGDQNLTWQLTRARWLLNGSDQKDAIQGALLLNDITRSSPDLLAPHVLLADCLLRLGEETGAIEQLTAAVNLEPQSAGLALKLAELYSKRGEAERARTYLDRVLENPTALPSQRVKAAELVASSGDADTALRVLEKQYATTTPDAHIEVLMAQLYRTTHQADRLNALCPRLLETNDAQSIMLVANFYASQGRGPDAKAALDRLDQATGGVAEKQILKGEYELSYGDPKGALRDFQSATVSMPSNRTGWVHTILAQLALGRPQDAQATAEAGLKILPADKGLKAFLEQFAVALSLRPKWPEGPELACVVLQTPETEASVADALKEFKNSDSDATAFETASRLQGLAGRYDDLEPLQKAAIRVEMTCGQPSEAASIALRAARKFPADVQIAQMSGVALAAAGRWDEVLPAAQEWRRRDDADPMDADVLLASAHLKLGDVSSAKATLEPYLHKAGGSDQDRYMAAVLAYADADIQSGQIDEAASLLRPHLSRSLRWRVAWMQLAATQVPDRTRAIQWLNEVSRDLDRSSADEPIMLAEAWESLGMRFHQREDFSTAQHLAESAIAGSKPNPRVLLAIAQIQEADGSIDAAERNYRQVVQEDPSLSIAQNNLAMLLARQGKDLDFAIVAADKAAADAGSANHADFLETQAFVEFKVGRVHDAAATLEQAIQAQPDNPGWQFELAQWLADGGERQKARNVLIQLESRPDYADRLDAETQKQVRSLDAQLQTQMPPTN